MPPTATDLLLSPSYWDNAKDMPSRATGFESNLVGEYIDELKFAAKVLKRFSKHYGFSEIDQGEYIPMSQPDSDQPVMYLIKDDIIIHHRDHPRIDSRTEYLYDEDFDKKAEAILYGGYFAGKPVANRKIGYGIATELRRTAMLATFAGSIASFICIPTSEARRRKPQFEVFGMYTRIGQNYELKVGESIDRISKITRAGIVTSR